MWIVVPSARPCSSDSFEEHVDDTDHGLKFVPLSDSIIMIEEDALLLQAI
jgi:hypothetical protein